MPTQRPVAAFDFDGTITDRDTMVPFLSVVAGRFGLASAVVRDLPRLALVGARLASRDAAKGRLIRRLFAGRDAEAVRALGRQHAQHVLETWIRPSMIERIQWHRDEGHELAIVSASLDSYLDAIGPKLGFDHVVCTTLEAKDGTLTGSMLGGNCRRAAKVERLRAAVPDLGARELWAYGDSGGDTELLAAADHPVRVDRHGTFR